MQSNTSKRILVLSLTVFLASCANTTTMHPQSEAISIAQAPTNKVSTIAVNWENVEAFAQPRIVNQSDSRFAESPVLQMMAKSYASSYGVTIIEAKRRLMLQDIGSIIIEAIKKDLGEAFVGAYIDNSDPNDYKVGITTLNNVKAERYEYPIIRQGQKIDALSIVIHPISDKTEAYITQLIEQNYPEMKMHYPDIQMVSYNPVSNMIDVLIYNKKPDEEGQTRIEAKLTELVGHPVQVEFIAGRIEVL